MLGNLIFFNLRNHTQNVIEIIFITYFTKVQVIELGFNLKFLTILCLLFQRFTKKNCL